MLAPRILALAVLLSASLQAAAVELVAGGGTGGPGANAREIQLMEPFGVAFNRAGDMYINEYTSSRLIRIDSTGQTALIAGSETLHEPHGIVMNQSDQLFIADTRHNRVLRLDGPGQAMLPVAGKSELGFSGDGGPATQALFNGIFSIDLAPDGGSLYLADLSNRRVRRVDLQSGVVTTIAGNGEQGIPADGALASESPLVDPRAVTADADGNVYILERRGNALRVVDSGGHIRTLIKPGDVSPDLNGPKHLSMDPDGTILIADTENHLIRRYDPKSGKTTTLVGTGEVGDRLDPSDPLRTQLSRPHGVLIGADGALYISDSDNHRILKVTGL